MEQTLPPPPTKPPIKHGNKVSALTVPAASSSTSSHHDNEKEEEAPQDHWDFLREKFTNMLAVGSCRHINYEPMYRRAYIMVAEQRRATELSEGVRSLVTEHVRGMVEKLQAVQLVVEEEHEENGLDLDVFRHPQFLLQVGQTWYSFLRMMENFRDALMYMERIYENVVGFESIVVFAWKLFRAELLENVAIRERLTVEMERNPAFLEESTAVVQELPDINKMDLSEDLVPFAESALFSSDTILDVMTFLPSTNIGLGCAPAARQLAYLSGYMLTKRRRLLAPISICCIKKEAAKEVKATAANEAEGSQNLQKEEEEEQNQESQQNLQEHQDSLAIPLAKSHAADDESVILDPSKSQGFPLPAIEPPGWITGVSVLHVNLEDTFTAEMLAFVHSLRAHLHNCHLHFASLASLKAAFVDEKEEKRQKEGINKKEDTEEEEEEDKVRDKLLLKWKLLRLLDGCCFSLRQQQQHTAAPAHLEWPLWAVFNDLLFTQCRQLELPIGLMATEANGTDAAKWLLHPSSTERHPRRLKFFSGNNANNNPNWQLTSRGVAAMVELIKKDFSSSSHQPQQSPDSSSINTSSNNNRRCFFVQFPPDGLHPRDWGQWLNNGNGERLVVSQLDIARLPLELGEEDGQKPRMMTSKFEDFYPHMKEEEQHKNVQPSPPKIVFSTPVRVLPMPVFPYNINLNININFA